MKKTLSLKLMLLGLLVSFGCMSAFAQASPQLLGSTQFLSNGIKYQILSIDKAQKKGTAAVSVNLLNPIPETLTIDEKFEANVSGYVLEQYFSDKVEFTVIGIQNNGYGLDMNPNTGEVIGQQMIGLKKIIIPKSVQYIGECAFNNAGELEEVEFEAGSQLKGIGSAAFDNTNVKVLDLTPCTQLETLGYGKQWVFDGLNFTLVTIDRLSTPFISADGDHVNRQLEEVKLPAQIENIGIAFAKCENLKKLDLSGTKVYDLMPYALFDTPLLASGAKGYEDFTTFVIPGAPENVNRPCRIGENAFYYSGIKNLVINGNIRSLTSSSLNPLGVNPISADAYKGMFNLKTLTFNGDLMAEAIPANAFVYTDKNGNTQKSPLETITFNGKLTNATTDIEVLEYPIVAAQACKSLPTLKEVTFNNTIDTGNAVGYQAFANCGSLNTINLKGNLNAIAAIGHEAFANSGNNATLTIGTPEGNGILKSMPIASDAFDGASLAIVNLYKLDAPQAINEAQFEGAKKVATVNFNYDINCTNVLGANAFSNNTLATVNINGNILKESAFKGFGEENSPFYMAGDRASGKGFTLNLNGNKIVSNGFGEFAFAGANLKTINMNKDAEYGFQAFAPLSFYDINYGEATPSVWVNYLPSLATDVLAIAETAFYTPTDVVDIYFRTTPEVKKTYEKPNVGGDLTPWRMKFIMSIGIETFQASNTAQAYGIFPPQDEPYVIDKYSDANKDLKVKVYSAYVDDHSLTGSYDDPDGAKADLYINPLRVQDNGKYVINRGHAVLVVTDTPGEVIADQNIAPFYPPYEDGGIQTFAGLNVWQANDLRYNPTVQIYESANDNGYRDFYGNKLYDYEIFRLKNPSDGFEYRWPNTKKIFPTSLYVMVGKYGPNDAQLNARKAYSTNGDPNWFFNDGKSWKEKYQDLLDEIAKLEQDLAASEGADETLLGLLAAVSEANEGVADAQKDLADAKDAYAEADQKVYGTYETYVDDEGNVVPVFEGGEEGEDGEDNTPGTIVRKDGGLQGEYDEKKADMEEMLYGIPAETYSAEEAAEYNASLEGAVSAGDPIDPTDPDSEVYDEDSAAEYNASLDDAVKEGDPKDGSEAVEGILDMQAAIDDLKGQSDQALTDWQDAQAQADADQAAYVPVHKAVFGKGGTRANPAEGSLAYEYNHAKAELDYWKSVAEFLEDHFIDEWEGSDQSPEGRYLSDYDNSDAINDLIESLEDDLYGEDGIADDPAEGSLAADYQEAYDAFVEAYNTKEASKKAAQEAGEKHSALHTEYNEALEGLYGASETEGQEPSESNYTENSLYGQYVALNEELYGIKNNPAAGTGNTFPGSEEEGDYAPYDEESDENCLWAELQHAKEELTDAETALDNAKAALAEAEEELADAYDDIEEHMDDYDQIGGARLNLIWTDRDGVEDVTAIMEAVVAKNGSKNLKGTYNMQGVKVDNPTAKGVYIHDGKKVIK